MALAVLGVVAAIGVVIALRGPEAPDAAGPAPLAGGTATSSPSDQPSDTEPAEPTTPVPTESTSMLVAEEGDTRLRAPVVGCEEGLAPIQVELSIGGGPWQASSVPGLVTVTGLQIVGDGFTRVVGHEPDCTPASYVSRNGGGSWSPAAGEVRFWSVLPENSDQVASPGGAVKVPCVPRAVSAINATVARLWCEGGQIVGTADGGAHWVALGSLADAESIAYLDAADGVALAVDPECDGISVLVTRDGGVDWETVHCAEIAGPWGLVTDATTITVLGADAAETSDDVGGSWTSG